MTNTDFTADIDARGTRIMSASINGRFYVQMDIDAMPAGPITHTRDPSDPEELTSDLAGPLPIGFSDVLNEPGSATGSRYRYRRTALPMLTTRLAAPDFYGQSPARGVVHMNVLGVDIDGYFHWSHLDI